MTTRCLSEDDLLSWIDGGIPPNRVESLEGHVSGCKRCRDALAEMKGFATDIAAPVNVDDDAHVAAIMRRLDETRPAAPAPRASRARLYGGALAVALAAAVLLLVGRTVGRDPDPDLAFAARGGDAGRSLARDVGATVLTGTNALVPVAPGAAIADGASLTAAYTNVHPRPVRLLLFGVDAQGVVHWLYPAYVDPREDPSAVLLERSERPRAMPTSVVLDHPARGRMRLVSLFTTGNLHVSDIEGRPPSELTLPSLRLRFADAYITELPIEIP